MIQPLKESSSTNASHPPLGTVGVLAVLIGSLVLASFVSHMVKSWVGLPGAGVTYRRIGPKEGPQVFCAGSSLVQFGLDWPVLSKTWNQGIENWGVGGSTPEIWEISQRLATNANVTLVGVSIYDLNEFRLCDSRADFVSVQQTGRDLWDSGADWLFAKRMLSQYPLALMRKVFPTAGKSEGTLTGLRKKVRSLLKLSSSSEDAASAVVVPKNPVLEFGVSALKLSELSKPRLLRRLASMRNEIQGKHVFSGPKSLALKRVLQQGVKKGRVIVVVLPLSESYTQELVTRETQADFDRALQQAVHGVGPVEVVRLDGDPKLRSDSHFSDLVHLNSTGRGLATEMFLAKLNLPAERR